MAIPMPAWTRALDEKDLELIRRFVLRSGSLKALARDYRISYPTVRARLNRLIAKVRAANDPKLTDPLQRKLRLLVAGGDISPALARELLRLHRAASPKATASRPGGRRVDSSSGSR